MASGQLIEVSGARSESYSFDVNGNRTISGYETGDGNRLTSDGTYDYEYDAEGNLVVKTRISDGETTEYTWDYRNRLTAIVVTDAQENVVKEAHYTYDVFGRRIGVWEDADGEGSGEATERWTVYDGDNPWDLAEAAGDDDKLRDILKAMKQLGCRQSGDDRRQRRPGRRR